MKKLSVILAIAISLTACGSGNSDANSSTQSGAVASHDSLKKASDSVMQTGDTSALNSLRGDSTSKSGSHGQGSGSEVGGGKTGGPQGKKGK